MSAKEAKKQGANKKKKKKKKKMSHWVGVVPVADSLDGDSASEKVRAIRDIMKQLDECKFVTDVFELVRSWVRKQSNHFLYHEKPRDGLSANTRYTGEPVIEDLVRIELEGGYFLRTFLDMWRPSPEEIGKSILHLVMYPETVQYLKTKGCDLVERFDVYSTAHLACRTLRADGKTIPIVPTRLIEAYYDTFKKVSHAHCLRLPSSQMGGVHRQGALGLVKYGLFDSRALMLILPWEFEAYSPEELHALYKACGPACRDDPSFMSRIGESPAVFTYFCDHGFKPIERNWASINVIPEVLDLMEKRFDDQLFSFIPVFRDNALWFIHRRRPMARRNFYNIHVDIPLYIALQLNGMVPADVHAQVARELTPPHTFRDAFHTQWTRESLCKVDPDIARFLL
jgi:hypothetical protein